VQWTPKTPRLSCNLDKTSHSSILPRRSASELRASLDRGVRSKASLESVVRTLARSQRQEDATAVEGAIADAQPNSALLQVTVASGYCLFQCCNHLWMAGLFIRTLSPGQLR